MFLGTGYSIFIKEQHSDIRIVKFFEMISLAMRKI